MQYYFRQLCCGRSCFRYVCSSQSVCAHRIKT